MCARECGCARPARVAFLQALGFFARVASRKPAAAELGLWPEEGARRRALSFCCCFLCLESCKGTRLGGAARSPGLLAPGAPGRPG